LVDPILDLPAEFESFDGLEGDDGGASMFSKPPSATKAPGPSLGA
jgi:hypothetical protein